MTKGPLQVERAERAAKAVKLRTAGMSYDEIGFALGISKTNAWKYTNRALRQLPAEDAATLRQLEGAKLDALWAAFYPKAIDGDIEAAGVCIRLSGARRRLFGLDAEGPANGSNGGVVVQQILISPALAMQPQIAPDQPAPIEPPANTIDRGDLDAGIVDEVPVEDVP